MKYKPRGICASAIDVEMDGNIIRSVKFKRLKGITCGFRDTSCPDQLAVCLEKMLQNV